MMEFLQWTQGEFNHGAIAFYQDWKAGEFKKIVKDRLIRRIERHFGELIRKGEIEILVWEGKGIMAGQCLPERISMNASLRDYSNLAKITFQKLNIFKT